VTEARAGDGRAWRAVVEGVPATLGETRRLSFTLRLSGAPLPIPGSPLEVRVPLATGVILPQSALQQIEGVWGVFVRDGEKARFAPVRRGAELGGDVLVLEGVAPGDVVVTDGAYLLKSLRLRRSGAEEEHEH
jgi:cobalt-zinc-cadmium efflux system membrane fusion protein